MLMLGYRIGEDICCMGLRERERVSINDRFAHWLVLTLEPLLSHSASTVYAVVSRHHYISCAVIADFFYQAGELGLEIYSLSLASNLSVSLFSISISAHSDPTASTIHSCSEPCPPCQSTVFCSSKTLTARSHQETKPRNLKNNDRPCTMAGYPHL